MSMEDNLIILQSLVFNFLMQLVPIIIVAIIAWLILSRITKRFEQKADERLILERENSAMLNKRFDELNQRLMVIEKMLKEVE